MRVHIIEVQSRRSLERRRSIRIALAFQVDRAEIVMCLSIVRRECQDPLVGDHGLVKTIETEKRGSQGVMSFNEPTIQTNRRLQSRDGFGKLILPVISSSEVVVLFGKIIL